jgi:hypothetical protein
MPIATASQAWAILARHARDEIQSLRLQELCQDNDRVSSLVTVRSSGADYDNSLIVDFSRQRMTLETLNHLLHLAHARGVIQFMQEELPYHNYAKPNQSLYLALLISISIPVVPHRRVTKVLPLSTLVPSFTTNGNAFNGCRNPFDGANSGA